MCPRSSTGSPTRPAPLSYKYKCNPFICYLHSLFLLRPLEPSSLPPSSSHAASRDESGEDDERDEGQDREEEVLHFEVPDDVRLGADLLGPDERGLPRRLLAPLLLLLPLLCHRPLPRLSLIFSPFVLGG